MEGVSGRYREAEEMPAALLEVNAASTSLLRSGRGRQIKAAVLQSYTCCDTQMRKITHGIVNRMKLYLAKEAVLLKNSWTSDDVD